MLTLVTWLGESLSGFPTVVPFLRLPYSAAQSEVTTHPTREERGAVSCLLEDKICTSIILHGRGILSRPFSYSVIHISKDLWIFISYLGPVIQCYFIYFVAQVVPALATGSSFGWPRCPFDMPSSVQGLWVFLLF